MNTTHNIGHRDQDSNLARIALLIFLGHLIMSQVDLRELLIHLLRQLDEADLITTLHSSQLRIDNHTQPAIISIIRGVDCFTQSY